MNPKIIIAKERKLIGMRLEMSLVENRTVDLFRGFMPRKKEITTNVSNEVIALQHFNFETFTAQTKFEKWACVEVNDFKEIPNNMETLVLEAGKYAVFIHRGTSEAFENSMKKFLFDWLPRTEYKIDSRPHFEILGKDYLGHNNPNSKEEVWIPIR